MNACMQVHEYVHVHAHAYKTFGLALYLCVHVYDYAHNKTVKQAYHDYLTETDSATFTMCNSSAQPLPRHYYRCTTKALALARLLIDKSESSNESTIVT